MHRLSNRIEKLERATPAIEARIVHIDPDVTVAAAIAAHQRAQGPIPDGTPVIFIHHSFISAL